MTLNLFQAIRIFNNKNWALRIVLVCLVILRGLFVAGFEKIENAPQCSGPFVSSYESRLVKDAEDLFYAGRETADYR